LINKINGLKNEEKSKPNVKERKTMGKYRSDDV